MYLSLLVDCGPLSSYEDGMDLRCGINESALLWCSASLAVWPAALLWCCPMLCRASSGTSRCTHVRLLIEDAADDSTLLAAQADVLSWLQALDWRAMLLCAMQHLQGIVQLCLQPPASASYWHPVLAASSQVPVQPVIASTSPAAQQAMVLCSHAPGPHAGASHQNTVMIASLWGCCLVFRACPGPSWRSTCWPPEARDTSDGAVCKTEDAGGPQAQHSAQVGLQ